MTLDLDYATITFRLLLAIITGGIIGFDREFKSRPAGIRTHVLVCVGACIIALIQVNIGYEVLNLASQYPALAGAVRADPARLIAQVVSGIGFLGAGTIVINKRSVSGLTTAASIWTAAGLGLAAGMGYYKVAIIGLILVIAILTTLKKIIHLPEIRYMEVKYGDAPETCDYIFKCFDEYGVHVKGQNLDISYEKNVRYHTAGYTIELAKHTNCDSLVKRLSKCEDIVKVRTSNG